MADLAGARSTNPGGRGYPHALRRRAVALVALHGAARATDLLRSSSDASPSRRTVERWAREAGALPASRSEATAAVWATRREPGFDQRCARLYAGGRRSITDVATILGVGRDRVWRALRRWGTPRPAPQTAARARAWSGTTPASRARVQRLRLMVDMALEGEPWAAVARAAGLGAGEAAHRRAREHVRRCCHHVGHDWARIAAREHRMGTRGEGAKAPKPRL